MPDPNIQQALDHAIHLHFIGQYQQAERMYLEILAQDTRNADAMRLRGLLVAQTGRPEVGIVLIRQAIALQPNSAKAYGNLGDAYKRVGRLDLAEESVRTALRLDPNNANIYSQLALIHQDRNELEQAIAALRSAVAIDPNCGQGYHRLLLLLHCDPNSDAKSIFEEHRKWNQLCAQPLRQFIKPHANDRDPERPLRIGYISQDFNQQPMAFFILPLLRNHDRRQVQIVGYGEVTKPDMITDRIRALCEDWRFTQQFSDEQLADQIRADRIDIMVDLSLHSTPTRLMALARKPAPVQVTYLGYCSTTGMDAIDYRLTDPYLDPPGTGDEFYSEKSIRLPETYWCYEPLIEPPPAPSPALGNGFVTFGCLNNFIKVSTPALETFLKVMTAVPNSRLILHAHPGAHRQRIEEELRRRNIDPSRLKFVGYLPLHEYFNVYQQIDIALDPFPYGGGTTTLDALLAGVPVVTLRGKLAVGRGGVSILSNVGFPELIADTLDEYQAIAIKLAGDLPRLAQLRTSLPSALKKSPLTDAPRFARNIEQAYRQMWREYCEAGL